MLAGELCPGGMEIVAEGTWQRCGDGAGLPCRHRDLCFSGCTGISRAQGSVLTQTGLMFLGGIITEG